MHQAILLNNNSERSFAPLPDAALIAPALPARPALDISRIERLPRAAIDEFLGALSERTICERFYCTRRVPSIYRAALLAPTEHGVVALGAVSQHEGPKLLGIADSLNTAPRPTCSVLVRDGCQGRGLGVQLAAGLVEELRRHGIEMIDMVYEACSGAVPALLQSLVRRGLLEVERREYGAGSVRAVARILPVAAAPS